MMKRLIALVLTVLSILSLTACGSSESSAGSGYDGDTIVLRICNWEEYIDEGGWDPEEETIDLESGDIIGENPLIEDFEDWYYETYGKKVRVEYSTFGTNEDLYNQLNLGDVYDLVCPSDYMIMKLMAEKKLTPFSDEFFDNENEYNYYTNGVSDYIRNVFESNKINDESWSKYAAGYMWGTTGIVYNPEYVSEEDAESWEILRNKDYERKITIKDNVRDSMFAALAILRSDELTKPDFVKSDNYTDKIQRIMNDTSIDTVNGCEDVLREMRDVAYSFETDSGKADMVTGKVVANYQWSGDAVYTLDQADEDDVTLYYSVPKECSYLWFDGWVMLKKGIGNDKERQQAAEAFVNFLSRPDNAIRNMYYIGYTSTIAGGEDERIVEYMDWNYGAETEDEEESEEDEDGDEEDSETGDGSESGESSEEGSDSEAESGDDSDSASGFGNDSEEASDEDSELVDYDVSYFFGHEVIITAEAEQLHRQLFAQYPTEEVIRRCAVMWYFDDDAQKRINQMWINVRCYDLRKAVLPLIIIAGIVLILIGVVVIKKYRYNHK